MKCEECDRVLLKNEKTCPYCGHVYGVSNPVLFVMTLALLAAIVFAWYTWLR